MTLDQVVAEVEADLKQGWLDGTKAALVALVPSLAVWFLSPIGKVVWSLVLQPALGWLADLWIKFLDNKGFYLYKASVNNSEASAYEDAVRANRAAVDSGDANAIAASKAARRAAFLALFPLTA